MICLGFEVKLYDLEVIECESLWSVLRRWLARLWRLIENEEEKDDLPAV